MSFELHHGDCLDVMEAMDPGSIDAIVTDPPYALVEPRSGGDGKGRAPGVAFCPRTEEVKARRKGGFMGKSWDAALPDIGVWLECLRVLKPGGYLLAFGGTRTYHRLTCSIEDAGFEIRDSILTWVYGSGFPKGKGCLKPAWEPIVLARKPGKKVLPLGIDECRVAGAVDAYSTPGAGMVGSDRVYGGGYIGGYDGSSNPHPDSIRHHAAGRWPPNLLLVHHPDCAINDGSSGGNDGSSGPCDGSCHPDCVVRSLGEQSGESKSNPHRKAGSKRGSTNCYAQDAYTQTYERIDWNGPGDTGTAARFYPQFKYCSKASRRDRNEGCEGMEAVATSPYNERPSGTFNEGRPRPGRSNLPAMKQNTHPCVKPTPLLEWLVRLACPEGGTVLDPFMGSGSTGKACMRAGRDFVGIEKDQEWLPVARARIEHAACAGT